LMYYIIRHVVESMQSLGKTPLHFLDKLNVLLLIRGSNNSIIPKQ